MSSSSSRATIKEKKTKMAFSCVWTLLRWAFFLAILAWIIQYWLTTKTYLFSEEEVAAIAKKHVGMFPGYFFLRHVNPGHRPWMFDTDRLIVRGALTRHRRFLVVATGWTRAFGPRNSARYFGLTDSMTRLWQTQPLLPDTLRSTVICKTPTTNRQRRWASFLTR